MKCHSKWLKFAVAFDRDAHRIENLCPSESNLHLALVPKPEEEWPTAAALRHGTKYHLADLSGRSRGHRRIECPSLTITTFRPAPTIDFAGCSRRPRYGVADERRAKIKTFAASPNDSDFPRVLWPLTQP